MLKGRSIVLRRSGKPLSAPSSKLELAAAEYDVRWIDPVSGKATAGTPIRSAGGVETLVSPAFINDIALSLKLAK